MSLRNLILETGFPRPGKPGVVRIWIRYKPIQLATLLSLAIMETSGQKKQHKIH